METDELPPDLVEVTPSSPTPDRVIPITLLTGYLGSGKTTLLQYILTAQHGYRIAVCMNDFGDSTDIESTSMSFTPQTSSSSEETQFLSLPNGCLCCSIKEPGIAAIENMLLEQTGIDRVVVELTGVADPGEIARTFWTNEEMGGHLKLDGVVCVVDSRNILQQLKKGVDCQKQIAASDVILLNKIDLVTPQALDEIELQIRRINPTALFRRTLRSNIDVQDAFGIGSYGVNKDLDLDGVLGRLDTGSHSRRDSEKREQGEEGHEHEHDENCGHGDHADHLDGIGSIVLNIPVIPETTLDRLESFLQAVHWDSKFPSAVTTTTTTTTDGATDDIPSIASGTNENGSKEEETFEILRTKGLFPTHSGGLYVLQGVRDIFELNRLGDKREGKDKVEEGKLVLIGRKLGDRGEWEEKLRGWLGL